MQLDLSSVGKQDAYPKLKTKDYYVVYQMTNMRNNYIYVGAHKCSDIWDKYEGSGRYLNRVYKEEGKSHFTKSILFVFDNEDEMYAKEGEIVDAEFVSREDTYNRRIGGQKSPLSDTALYRRADGTGKNCLLSTNHPDVLSNIYISTHKGFISVKDEFGNTSYVSIDNEDYESGKLVHVTSGRVTVRDEFGNTSSVSVDNEDYKSGKLVHNRKGHKWSKKQRDLIGDSRQGVNSSNFGMRKLYNDALQLKIYDRFSTIELVTLIDIGWHLSCEDKDRSYRRINRKNYNTAEKIHILPK